jgi:hypothetical protein
MITNRPKARMVMQPVGAAVTPSYEKRDKSGNPIKKATWGKTHNHKLVRRSHLMTIIAAWLLTVPATSLILPN